ncbi:zinc-binding alcohol dehydrogenase family protein [Streptomyces sp. NBC_00620]|uniref:quinone oxidoreductase family protein n=1 Tax=Streptomyces sp. NBC_00620 TaxID=2903666 RepID=UPI0022521141|nr:zinc-binding alcohol dehydrogenase family protein [Streptomyces sp. NBC_00620]MCX4974971.1 zinc-binding alcohol dehydrogenase family protein [Streptomyces sp. NBC_00620]
MYAAVVHSFDAPPRFDTIDTPRPDGEHEILVDVLAAGLHPRVRSDADGTHYTSGGVLPLVPGIDAVGRTPQGELLYFVAPDTALGTMAEQAVVDRRRAITLPAGADPVAVAAAMNPGMSSWVALRRRVTLEPGARVLILGATGNSGQLAVQIAKHLGAAHVVAAGRDPERLDLLPGLGADETVSLLGDPEKVADQLGRSAGDADVVIDYLWGPVAEHAMPALLAARPERAKPLAWIQIGSMAGAEITLPSYLLRAANLQIMGSGQGSVTTAGIVAELPSLATEIASGTLAVDPLALPLSGVERAWSTPTAPGQRIVLTPAD